MLNNELNLLVKKAYRNNLLSMLLTLVFLLAPLISHYRKHIIVNSKKTTRQHSQNEAIQQASTIQSIQQMNSIEQYTRRNSSKLTSSSLIVIQQRRNTASPQKLRRIISLYQNDNLQQLSNILTEISKIEFDSNSKKKSQTLLLRNIRIYKQQFIKYLERTYPIIICEQIAKAIKVPQVLNAQEYKQLINKLENLDLKQQIQLCFLIYDINNQGYITTHDLIEIFKYNNNLAVEMDLLHMIKHTKIQISNQINKDINQNNSLVLPTNLIKVKLDKSVILQQRRLSLISPNGKIQCMSRNSQKNSPDYTIDLNQDSYQLNKNSTPMKKLVLITQIHKVDSNDNYLDSSIQGQNNNNRSDKLKKKNKTLNDDYKTSTDLSRFLSIWFPTRPNVFYDIIKTLTN